MNRYGQEYIGSINGKSVFVSSDAVAQAGMRRIKEELGMIKRFPVQIDLSGNTVMVEGDSHEDAVRRYLEGVTKP